MRYIISVNSNKWRALLVLAALILSGCGGGGGGGGGGGTGGSPDTVTITGTLEDEVNQLPLTGRTVTVQGSTLSGTTNSSGSFSILSVPIGQQVLVVTDSLGDNDGTETVTVSGASGSTDALGVFLMSTATSPPAPPPFVKSNP